MSLYDGDILEWSGQQARLLRQLAERRPGNEAPDWNNIIEEVESVGREQLHAVESLWTLAFLHDLKCEAWPLSRDVPRWRAEARGFRIQARRRFAPSMRQRIDLAGLYADALKQMPDTVDDQPPLPMPAVCPITLDDLLALDD